MLWNKKAKVKQFIEYTVQRYNIVSTKRFEEWNYRSSWDVLLLLWRTLLPTPSTRPSKNAQLQQRCIVSFPLPPPPRIAVRFSSSLRRCSDPSSGFLSLLSILYSLCCRRSSIFMSNLTNIKLIHNTRIKIFDLLKKSLINKTKLLWLHSICN